MIWTTSCVLLLTSLLCVHAEMFGTSPLEWSAHDVTQFQGHALVRGARHTRSIAEHMPLCASIPRLIDLQNRFRTYFDHDHDGVATAKEVQSFFQQFKPSVKKEAVTSFIARRDSNGNGAIEFIPEYVADLLSDDFTLEGAKEWFYLQDLDDNDAITPEELIKVAIAMGMTSREAWGPMVNYYMTYDINKDGQLSFDEFRMIYSA